MAILREMNVSASTMKLALNEDLHYYSYKRPRGQLLTEKAREERLTKGKKLLSKVKHPAEPQTIWFFYDEKNLCQDQKHNMQNNRWLAYSPNDTPRVMQTKFSETVMVFGCVSCECDAMPPHFFIEGLRLNSYASVEFLITVVKPWITRVANGRPYAWQQDSVPSHMSWKSKKMVVSEFLQLHQSQCFPPNYPDLNPMDYYVWDAVEKDAIRRVSTTKEQIINIIKAVFETLPRECNISLLQVPGPD